MRDVVIVPIGFISDHMEVLFDLDTEAKQTADELGLNMVRAATVGTHPRFVRMIRELIVERTERCRRPRRARNLGPMPRCLPGRLLSATGSASNGGIGSRTVQLLALDDHRHGVAAAEAQRCQAALQILASAGHRAA